jgi:hypothetical protein
MQHDTGPACGDHFFRRNLRSTFLRLGPDRFTARFTALSRGDFRAVSPFAIKSAQPWAFFRKSSASRSRSTSLSFVFTDRLKALLALRIDLKAIFSCVRSSIWSSSSLARHENQS